MGCNAMLRKYSGHKKGPGVNSTLICQTSLIGETSRFYADGLEKGIFRRFQIPSCSKIIGQRPILHVTSNYILHRFRNFPTLAEYYVIMQQTVIRENDNVELKHDLIAYPTASSTHSKTRTLMILLV